jgi:hypothetical protein
LTPGMRVATASTDNTARIWGGHFASMSKKRLLVEVSTQRGLTKLSRNEMRLTGYSDGTPEIDVNPGLAQSIRFVTNLRMSEFVKGFGCRPCEMQSQASVMSAAGGSRH